MRWPCAGCKRHPGTITIIHRGRSLRLCWTCSRRHHHGGRLPTLTDRGARIRGSQRLREED